MKMTLDRIDNTVGHTKENVICACYRCNHMKSSMPFEVWTFFVGKVREARELGIFVNWRFERWFYEKKFDSMEKSRDK